MASGGRPASLREDLTCAICCDLFRDPVMLACMHHFCRACIDTYWRSIRGPVPCPQCRQEFPSRHFQANYLVAGLVEKVRANSSDGYVKNVEVKDSLESHRSKVMDYVQMIHRDKEQVESLKRVGAELQERIHGDFQALHSFLQDEEESILEELRREQEENVEEFQLHVVTLENAVKQLEQDMHVLQQQVNIMDSSVLAELPEVISRRPSLQVSKGPQFDMKDFCSKYISPLQYTTWRKMFFVLKPGPASFTLDEDTAHPSLSLSQDKTTVTEHPKRFPYPPNPRRFIQCVNVLGAQGFQSGRHYWEVEVGSKLKWDVSVALETVDRRARVKLCPENGYWTLRLRNGSQCSAGTQPWTPLRTVSVPRRIGVFVDFEDRRVSFYNADSMSLLWSFSNGPRGKTFPFISTCISALGEKPQPIRFLHHS
ncbi:tripartite motif containing 105 isoform X2 [Denticeps clupeoides]|uniref:tripartite motif containing 105 isoform X2 n=1 Tax=Denticeps clupeoides TaxID=299321 RepID=UPI0010A58113|nr:nuclear factor 7, brain-like isoform X2 [Denticeps clupeoides]